MVQFSAQEQFSHIYHQLKSINTTFTCVEFLQSVSFPGYRYLYNEKIMSCFLSAACLSTSRQAQRSVANHQRGKAGAGQGQRGDVERFQASGRGTPTSPLLRQELDQTGDGHDWHLVRHALKFFPSVPLILALCIDPGLMIWFQHLFVLSQEELF